MSTARKPITPPKGARTKTQVKEGEFIPSNRSPGRPQARSKGGRGNEMVGQDDVRRVAEQAITPEAQANRWDRVDNAIEFLRRYNEHLEQLIENKDKKLSPSDAMKLMDLVYRHKEKISDIVKSPLERLYDRARFTLVPEVFSDHDVTSLTVEGIGRCNILDDITVAYDGDSKQEKEVNKTDFYKWLIDNELEDMITQTVNAQTLAAFVRRQMQTRDGVKLPMDLLKITPVSRAQITRS